MRAFDGSQQVDAPVLGEFPRDCLLDEATPPPLLLGEGDTRRANRRTARVAVDVQEGVEAGAASPRPRGPSPGELGDPFDPDATPHRRYSGRRLAGDRRIQ